MRDAAVQWLARYKRYTFPRRHPLRATCVLMGMTDTDRDLENIRKTYLPETILAYVSTLHFAGTCLSRDHLLECMDLAAVIAQKGSNVATCLVKENKMKELVESFAACSKALAIVTGEKKSTGSNSKKMREMGWSRDLWSIRS